LLEASRSCNRLACTATVVSSAAIRLSSLLDCNDVMQELAGIIDCSRHGFDWHGDWFDSSTDDISDDASRVCRDFGKNIIRFGASRASSRTRFPRWT
jgi:hypothetical protein